MTPTNRIQLTLFVQEQEAGAIESIRRRFNPLQFDLIKSHVTLCREDELQQMERVMQNLEQLIHPPLQIGFGSPLRVEKGKGLLLPAISGQPVFQQLRKKILSGLIPEPRALEPHITLMHPRNSTCTDAVMQEIDPLKLPSLLTFSRISLIVQHNGRPWQTLCSFELSMA